MLALKITDIKTFMNQLLIGDLFDHFQMAEASITTFNTFTIDGTLQRDFFDTDTCDILDQSSICYSLWKEMKPFCYHVIRGKRTPLHFKIILQLPGDQANSVFTGKNGDTDYTLVKGLFLNLQYKNKELLCTTGVAMKTFVPDKTPEYLWDQAVLDFFHRWKISFENMQTG